MLKIVSQIFQLFDPREKRQMLGLLAASVITACLEVLGVASIMPFISILARPEIIVENEWLSRFYTMLNFSDSQSFLIVLGFLVLILMVTTNALLAFRTVLAERFVWAKHHRLSSQLLEGYLTQPYQALLKRNSAELSKNILVETTSLTRGLLTPFTELVANSVTTLFILLLLIAVDVKLAVVVVTVLGGAYATIYAALRRRLTVIGKKKVVSHTLQFKAVNEALGGFKDLKVLGREREFISRFVSVSRTYSGLMASSEILKGTPHFLMETIAFGSIIVIILYNMVVRGNINQIITIVGLYAFAGYRLMPAFKAIFKSLGQLRFQQASVDTILRELKEIEWVSQHLPPADEQIERLPFRQHLTLDHITFTYPEAETTVLNNLTLTIFRNQAIAFTGATGAGKTTLVDIILGLFSPQEGYIEVDGVRVDESNRRNWQAMLGYVPQQIFLSDDTIAANIAFGIPEGQIDRQAVERAARIANLHDFITQELTSGYNTSVGERGIRLSGGQRQRVGIARALYHDPDVLIMDEATSALDGITEQAVLKAIDNIAHSKTLIIIAHRLSTVQNCDVIYFMEKGRIVDQGTYDELLQINVRFRAMASSKHFDGNGYTAELEEEMAA